MAQDSPLPTWNRVLEWTLVGACVIVAVIAVHQSMTSNLQPPSFAAFPATLSQVAALSIPIQVGNKGSGTIVEALDFLCPPCHARNLSFDEARRDHPKLSWKTLLFPLAIHPGSFDYALAGLEAQEEGCYEKFQSSVMSKFPTANQSPISFFGSIGPWAVKCWNNRKRNLAAKERILNRIKRLPINGTPSLIAFKSSGQAVRTNSLSYALKFASSN